MSLRVRKSVARGSADYGWLKARHTFSFAEFYDPEFMGFGPMRVLNQDRILGGGGFPPHPHRDMEIVTFVLEGELEHRDSMGHGGVIGPGEVQFMSAGTGVQHSEFNASPTDELHLLQMWIKPAHRGNSPRYAQASYQIPEHESGLRLAVTPDGKEGALAIDQDASLYVGRLQKGHGLTHAMASGDSAWLHVATGSLMVNGTLLESGDGAAIESESESLTLEGVDPGQFVLWQFS